MIKFSKSGWNNVIIFAVMGFILLINATHKNVFSPENNPVKSGDEFAIVDPQQVILSLSIAKVITIERQGVGWLSKPKKLPEQALEQMMMSWQQNQGKLMSAAPSVDRKLALDVKLSLAGQFSDTLLLSFYATDNQLLMYHHQKKYWLAMPIAFFNQLFPQEIFSE